MHWLPIWIRILRTSNQVGVAKYKRKCLGGFYVIFLWLPILVSVEIGDTHASFIDKPMSDSVKHKKGSQNSVVLKFVYACQLAFFKNKLPVF